ncbi:glycosyltransferase family 2 protein [Zunongwangia sp. HRR-M8]|uniref:glycosyltransferase family 2 protein n=1 Tax=Zunongwangia sp. HRR-M8 TaxID=3015170 RepID=UPI0022DE194D|nr:glycosyltransferase [Zunongwangia sp. HRR-M8]WBL22045.1 glycosyltransferase [Zunongwangia sp. HRR-M8]
MKTIAVILTVFNRKKKTLDCLDGLFIQSIPSDIHIDVFMVDDGSTDGTSEAVAGRFPEVNVIRGSGDLFWNRGMHLAWTVALKKQEFDYYLWLNDDTYLKKDALKKLLKTSYDFKDKSIIVGTTCALDDHNKITYGGRSRKKGLLIPKQSPQECDYFNGNIVLIPFYVHKIVGLNDPIFRHALGDFDYGLRAKAEGVKMYIAPEILGKCDLHHELATWCNPKKSFLKRWKAFRSPLGNNPEEFYKFEKRHKGFGIALFHYITNHVRLVAPYLWN